MGFHFASIPDALPAHKGPALAENKERRPLTRHRTEGYKSCGRCYAIMTEGVAALSFLLNLE